MLLNEWQLLKKVTHHLQKSKKKSPNLWFDLGTLGRHQKFDKKWQLWLKLVKSTAKESNENKNKDCAARILFLASQERADRRQAKWVLVQSVCINEVPDPQGLIDWLSQKITF